MKQILFIQGASKGAYKADQNLVESLRRELGSKYEIHYPQMENEDNASYKTWAEQIESELSKLGDEIVLVAHSIGASILIKLLSEKVMRKALKGVFLIATPFWGGGKGWTYEGYEKLMLPLDSKLPRDIPLFFYQSHDDDTVPFAHLALYANKFPQAHVTEITDGGHQLNNDLSLVAKDIKSVV